MALATVNLAFDDDLVQKMDFIARNASITRTQLIYKKTM